MSEKKLQHNFQILTNLDCNLDCKYCYENKKEGLVNDMTAMKEFVDYSINCFVKENADDKTEDGKYKEGFVMDLIGGEVFYHFNEFREFFDYIIEEGNKADIHPRISISSNGTLLGKKEIKDYIFKNRDYFGIGISIDGPKKVHDKYRIFRDSRKGTYDTIIEAIPDYIEAGIAQGIKATFTKATWPYFAEAMKHAYLLGFRELAGNIIYENNVSIEDIEFDFKQYKEIIDYAIKTGLDEESELAHVFSYGKAIVFPIKDPSTPVEVNSNYCGGGKYMVTLGFDRRIYGCQRFCTMNRDEEMVLGRFENGKIFPTNKKLKEAICTVYEKRPDECKACPFIEACSFCAAAPFEHKGFNEEGIREYFKKKNTCGTTYSLELARAYYTYKKNLQKK